jgi:hypothetical protein
MNYEDNLGDLMEQDECQILEWLKEGRPERIKDVFDMGEGVLVLSEDQLNQLEEDNTVLVVDGEIYIDTRKIS